MLEIDMINSNNYIYEGRYISLTLLVIIRVLIFAT